jgi:CDP-diacylglycerol--glycerol-3-phosphate 3-phosphatidyltransferase
VMVLMLESTPYSTFWAAILFSVAAITDYLDGYIARKMGLVSVLGQLLDPLADKLIVMATLVVAAQLGHIPGWFVVLLLAREIGITGLRSIAGQEGLVIDVVQSGKLKTALQLCGLIGVILHYPYAVDFVFVQTVVDFSSLGFAVLGLSMVFSIISACSYFTRFMFAIDSKKKDGSIPTRGDHA